MPADKRYLTASQRSLLKAFVDNNGTAFGGTGTRWSSFAPGYFHIFAQAFHAPRYFKWVERVGDNQYVITAAGLAAYARGWYSPNDR